jgi:CRP-like cAMP-binding protein
VLGRIKHVDVIRRLPLSAALSREEIDGLAAIAVEREYAEGEYLTREGGAGRSFFVVLDGQVEVLQGEQRVASRGPGDFFGEIALVAHRPRTATVRTTTRVRALEIRDRSFRSLLGRQPQLQHKIISAIHDRLRAA